MRTNVLVYLSGPITASHGRSVEQHVAAALSVYLDLVRRRIPAICVHLGAAHPSAHLIDYETWMVQDLAVLEHCTHILMLPGSESSKGAQRELAHALALGLEVATSVDELAEMVGVE